MRTTLQGCLLAALAVLAFPLSADWAGFSDYAALAEVAIQPGRVALNLRMPLKALPELAKRVGESEPAPADSLARRLLQVLDGKGEPLRETQLQMAHDTAADGGQLDFVEITRVLSTDAFPAMLTLVPAAGMEDRLGLVVLDRGVPLADLAPLTRPLRVRLDPNDPWKSSLDDPGLVRRHVQPRSFLYVEPFEVRHEILLRLADLKRWLPVPLQDGKRLAEADQPAVTAAIGKLLKEHTRLSADGRDMQAESEQVQFVAFTRSGVQPLPPGPVDVNAALVGVVLVYLTEKPAASLALSWELFADKGGSWPISVLAGQEVFDAYVTPAQPTLDWARDDGFEPVTDQPPTALDTEPPLPASAPEQTPPDSGRRLATLAALLLPVGAWYLWLLNPRRRFGGMALAASLVIGAALGFYPGTHHARSSHNEELDESRLRESLPPLLHNAYRAFQLHGEEAVYDRLARSLDGELLEEIYLQQRRSLLRQSKGLGGLGKVDRVEIEHLKRVAGGSATAVEADWVAHGTVSHWGHTHPRHNRYRARLRLQAGSDKRLKITAMEFLDGQTLSSGPAS